MKLPRDHFSIMSMDDAAFFLKEFIPADKTVTCRDVFRAGLCYEFSRDSNGQVSTTIVHYGDDSIERNSSGETAVQEAFDARVSINAKWFPNR